MINYECQLLYLPSFSSLNKCLRVRTDPTQVQHLLGAPLQTLPANIRLSQKCLLGTNSLDYYCHLCITVVKSFITLGLAIQLHPEMVKGMGRLIKIYLFINLFKKIFLVYNKKYLNEKTYFSLIGTMKCMKYFLYIVDFLKNKK